MRFQGRLIRDGKWWLAEVPVFDALTQGRSVPTIDKLDQLLKAICPERDIVVHQSDAA